MKEALTKTFLRFMKIEPIPTFALLRNRYTQIEKVSLHLKSCFGGVPLSLSRQVHKADITNHFPTQVLRGSAVSLED